MYKTCIICEDEAEINYSGKNYCSKHYLEKLTNEKCVLCNNKSELGDYCIQHYVEKEEEECLYWDFNAIVRQLEPEEITKKSSDESNKLLAEITKKYPSFIERYKEECKKFKESIKDIKQSN